MQRFRTLRSQCTWIRIKKLWHETGDVRVNNLTEHHAAAIGIFRAYDEVLRIRM
jgi:hypothetical protein